MTMMKVLPYPNPFLRRKARRVEVFDDDLADLIRNMEETMSDEEGLGLAATQVGVDRQLLVLNPYAFRGEEGRGEPNVVIINPEVVWRSDETDVAEEGCLSFPGVFIPVERPRQVRVRAADVDGKVRKIEGQGLGARAILHEIDHLEGVVMIDHVSHLVRSRALKKHQKEQRTQEEPKPDAPDKRTGSSKFGKAKWPQRKERR